MRLHKRSTAPPRWLAALAALAAVWCAPAVALAGGAQTDAKPLAFILLDTSGNLEVCLDQAGANCEVDGEDPNSAIVPICHGSRQTGYAYEKSRWAAAVEVLTGTFNDFWCETHDRPKASDTGEEDWEWYIRHARPRGVEVGGQEQSSNGIVDLYDEQVKFGLMTFDSNQNTGIDSSGGFSYGTNRSGFNWGSRNADATFGAMVVPDTSEDAATVQAGNDAVQVQILATRPYGTTPTTPLLDDALYLFNNHDDVKDYDPTAIPPEGDPYSDCRSRAVILVVVADGESSDANWLEYYPTSIVAAAGLYAAGVKVYVVGFQATEDELDFLDDVADAGGTDTAYVADDQAGLSSRLSEILVDLRGNRPTRARSVLTNRTLRFVDKQYQIFASFSPSLSPLDEQGHLDQYVYRCEDVCRPVDWESGDGAALCEIFSLDDKLNARTDDRVIYTQLEGVLQAVTVDNDEITEELLQIPTTSGLMLPQLDPEDLGDGQKLYSGRTLGDAGESAVRIEYRAQLLRLIRGDLTGRRGEARLGAIVHSEPVVQADLYSMTIPVPSFNTYRTLEGVMGRPTTLFVGTHEGMLHAFRVDRLAEDDDEIEPPNYDHGLTEEEYGEELWGFIPKHLLEKADSLAEGMEYLLDGDPIVREVRLFKTRAEIGAENPPSLQTEADRWRSVLLTGYGDGGRGYFALDVTFPDAVSRTTDPEDKFQFKWEISNTEVCDVTNGCSASTDFAHLGTSESAAAIGAAYFQDPDTLIYQEKAIAIFGGGGEIGGDADAGKAIYVVDLDTGALIREFCNDTVTCGSSIIDDGSGGGSVDGFDCPITGDVAAFDDTPGSSLTRAFVGDSCGQIWRLDLTDDNPADWTVERFYDAFSSLSLNPHSAGFALRRPIKIRPTTAIGYQRGQLILVAGTGNPDEAAGTEPDRVFSIKEAWDATEGKHEAFVNWDMALESGEIYTGEPVIFDEVAYFTTLAPSEEGSCAVGGGRLWGVHYTGTDTESTEDVEAKLDVNDDPDLVTLATYQEFVGAELYGLQLVQRSACTDSTLNYEPWLTDSYEVANDEIGDDRNFYSDPNAASFGTGTSGGALELVVQTSDLGAPEPELEAPGGDATGTGTKKIMGVTPPAQSVFSASWGLLFD